MEDGSKRASPRGASGSPRAQATTGAGGIRAKDAINSKEYLHAPPLIKARLLIEMATKAEYRRPHYRLFAKDLILNAFGQDLHQLKREITAMNTGANLVTVVYEFIQRPVDRDEVLAHMRAQVPHIKFHTARDRVIVLSDVDDTLFQSSALMGGPKYPSKAKFPGVEKLYMELAWKVVFITARPAVMKAMTLHEFQKKLQLPNIGILCGKTSDLLWAAFDRQKAWGKMALQKYHNFDMMSSLYPECQFVWFGDSGQGDLETGQMMMERKRQQMVAVFIHDIVESKGVTPKTGGMARTVMASTKNIIHIDTFLDAALHLNKSGHLSLQSLFRVACAVSDEWKELSTTGKWASEAVRTARAKEITADLEAVNMVLLKNGLATVTVCDTSLPDKLTPRISPRRKQQLLDEAHMNSLSGLEQLKLRASANVGAIDDGADNDADNGSGRARAGRARPASASPVSSAAAAAATNALPSVVAAKHQAAARERKVRVGSAPAQRRPGPIDTTRHRADAGIERLAAHIGLRAAGVAAGGGGGGGVAGLTRLQESKMRQVALEPAGS